jgi:hypothetical protein
MGKIVSAILAAGCFSLISVLWLSALALLGAVLIRLRYAFDTLDPTAWRQLYFHFQQGGTIPFSFLLWISGATLLAAIGEAAILWRLPSIVAAMPSPTLPRLPRLKRRPKTVPVKPKIEPASPPEPPPSPAPTEAPRQDSPAPVSNDKAILARILALFEVWNEPPPSWMAEALRDEVVLLSPDAWPTLETLGNQGLNLLVTLQAHDMLPESPLALRAIGEVEAVLRAGLAAERSEPGVDAPAPTLTITAAWLCEALENFLTAQADSSTPAERLVMAQTMLTQAMRGMGEPDWGSLDLFPEKASRVRVLTDRLREDMRRETASRAAAAATPLDSVLALLKQFGFSLENATEPLLAQRADMRVLLQTINLGGRTWRLPKGALGSWGSIEGDLDLSPGRQHWQQLARLRLKHADPRPLAGLLVLHGGHIEDEETLAHMVAADRRRSGIALTWLGEDDTILPTLHRQLSELPEQMLQDLRRERSAGHAAPQP